MTSNHTATQRNGRRRLMTAIAIIVISSSIWTTARMQHEVVARSIRRSRAADHMLTAMLDQETGLRGFLQTGRGAFLEPYRRGIRDFDAAVATARPAAEPELERRIDAQVAAARSWQALADRAIGDLRASPDVEVRDQDVTRRKLAFDEVRERNADVQAVVADAVGDDLERAELVASGVVLGLVVLFGAVGYVSIERQAARNRRRYRSEAAYRDSQTEFEQTMQVMRDEHEAYELVKTHLERTIPTPS